VFLNSLQALTSLTASQQNLTIFSEEKKNGIGIVLGFIVIEKYILTWVHGYSDIILLLLQQLGQYKAQDMDYIHFCYILYLFG
jgi:hypothetical protein